MKKAVAVFAAGFALLATQAYSAVTFDFIFDGGAPVSVSSNGSVVTGTLATGDYGGFRWTQATGLVSLGRPQVGNGGGVPGISADGTRIGYSIGSLDNSYRTQGLWTLGSGWQELMPPPPPDGGTVDGSYGSVWDISGDGNTVVGLYWRPGVGNRAHASKWTQATGVVDLGGTITGQASRANGVNHNASVIVGWVETPTGPWRPAAWVNGSLVLLTDYDDSGMFLIGNGEAKATSTNGDIIVGFSTDADSHQRAASMWKRTDGVFGPTELLGWVDGTEPGSGTSSGGLNIPWAVSDDGSIVVGYCSFDGSPFNPTGFVWTPGTGVVDVNQWLADQGVLVDPNFTIQNLTTMTPDGTKIFGYGQMLTPPYTMRAFRINVPNTVAAPLAAPVARIELSAPSPNPSSSATRMELALPLAASVDLSVYDASGRRVATLMHSELPVGRRAVTWDGREASGRPVAAGLYFARLVTPQGSAMRRIVRMD
jgi:uncharacterized membrane protein